MSDTMDKLGELLKKARDLGAQAVETVDKNDVEACAKLVAAFAESKLN